MPHNTLSEKSSFGVILEHTDSHDEKDSNLLASNAAVFDTPKQSLSRSTTQDHLTSPPPTKPCPAARRPKSLRVDTDGTQPDLEKGLLAKSNSTASLRDSTGNPLASPLYEPCREYSVSSKIKECSMWPSRQTLKTQAKQQKCQRRGSNFFGVSQRWGAMTKKQRLWIRILLVLVAIGVAVGVAIGITRAVGGGVWAGQGNNKTIPTTNH